MDYFSAIRAFLHAAESGSFSKAADRIAVKTSTVSRYVSELERDLGIALFNRSTRGLVLTEGGRVFREHAQAVLAALDEAREATSSLNASPRGLLRVTMPRAFGLRHVIPHLHEFTARYPGIDIDAVLSDETVNLIDNGIDLAIRIGVLPDSQLIARRLAMHRRIACASPTYLEQHGAPDSPAALAGHEVLRFPLMPDDRWWFAARAPRGEEQVDEPIPVQLRGRLTARRRYRRAAATRDRRLRHRPATGLGAGPCLARRPAGASAGRLGRPDGANRIGDLGGLSAEEDGVVEGARIHRFLCRSICAAGGLGKLTMRRAQ